MTLRVYLDTNIFIEAFEQTGITHEIAEAVFGQVERGVFFAVISELCVAELLVKPLRENEQDLIEAYSTLMLLPDAFSVCPINRDTLVEAARQRAINPGTKLPDAIHIATARLHECKVFLTTETRLHMPRDLIRLNLDNSTITELQALA